MNKKGLADVVWRGIVFLVLWLIGSIVFSFYLDGIYVPVSGVLVAIGGTTILNITLAGRG